MPATEKIRKERLIRHALIEIEAHMPKEPQSLRQWLLLLESLVKRADEHRELLMQPQITDKEAHEHVGVILKQLAGVSFAGARAMNDLVEGLNRGDNGA